MDGESKYHRAIATGLVGEMGVRIFFAEKRKHVELQILQQTHESLPAPGRCCGLRVSSCITPNSRLKGCLWGIVSAKELHVLEQPLAQTLNTQEPAVETADSFSPVSTMEPPQCGSETLCTSRNCASVLVKSMISLEKGRWLS